MRYQIKFSKDSKQIFKNTVSALHLDEAINKTIANAKKEGKIINIDEVWSIVKIYR